MDKYGIETGSLRLIKVPFYFRFFFGDTGRRVGASSIDRCEPSGTEFLLGSTVGVGDNTAYGRKWGCVKIGAAPFLNLL